MRKHAKARMTPAWKMPALLLLSCLPSVFSLSSPNKLTRIEVCQNKNCCRNFQLSGTALPQILSDLASNEGIEIEVTGCLSRCDKGPNVRISLTGDEQYYLQGVKDQVQVATELDFLGVEVPSKFLAACSVLQKAHIAQTPEEKDRFISSVIRSLDADEGSSSVHARALVMRSEMHLEASCFAEALQDAQRALGMKRATTATRIKAYRVSADVFERQGSFAEAIESLREWANADTSFLTKINEEIKRLRSATL